MNAFATVSECSGEITATNAIIKTASPKNNLFRLMFLCIAVYWHAKA